MKAQVLYGKEDLRLENRNIPKLKEDDILIKIKACGICKSDSEFFFNGKVGDFIVNKPIIVGHEASGIVEQIGTSVNNIKISDKVAIFPQLSCGMCDLCLKNMENICRNIKFLSAPPDTQGCFKEYIVHPAKLALKIKNNVSYEEAAMIEPTTIAYHGINLIGGMVGKNRIGIIGAGSIGILIGTLLNINSENKICFFDVNKKRIDFAISNVKNSSGYIINKNEYKFMNNLNLAFDVSGSESGANVAIENMDCRGKIALIGWSIDYRNLDLNKVVLKEIMLHGSVNFTFSEFKQIVNLVNENKINLKNVYQSGFELKELPKVMYCIKDKKFEKPKVIINI